VSVFGVIGVISSLSFVHSHSIPGIFLASFYFKFWNYVMHIYCIGSTCDDVFRTNIMIHSAYIFAKVLFTAIILPNIFLNLTRILFWIFSANLVGFLCKIMSAGSPPRRVR